MRVGKGIKNYIILFIVIFISIIVVIYFYLWHHAYEEEKLNISPVSEYLKVIHYNELDNYLVENKDAIIYVSKLNDNKIYDFEKKFRRFINKYSLNYNILYLDITTELDNNNILGDIKSKYGINVPYILIISNGKVESEYNIKDNNYSINLVKEYFVSEGLIND